MAAPMKKLDCPCDDCPKTGDVYTCETCGMALKITADCECADPKCVSLACCGEAMTKS